MKRLLITAVIIAAALQLSADGLNVRRRRAVTPPVVANQGPHPRTALSGNNLSPYVPVGRIDVVISTADENAVPWNDPAWQALYVEAGRIPIEVWRWRYTPGALPRLCSVASITVPAQPRLTFTFQIDPSKFGPGDVMFFESRRAYEVRYEVWRAGEITGTPALDTRLIWPPGAPEPPLTPKGAPWTIPDLLLSCE